MKSPRKYLKIRYIIPSLILLVVTFTLIDGALVSNGKSPLFVITTAEYQDGGSKRLSGMGYTITDYNQLTVIDPKGINEHHILKGHKFDHWFLPVSYSKTHFEEDKTQ